MKRSLAVLAAVLSAIVFSAGAPVVHASVSQAFSSTPSTFNQGDGADQISIAIANTSSNAALTSSLQVNGSLSAGILINTSSFVSGGWTCVSGAGGSAFACARQNALSANEVDTILLPVSIAANAPTGPNGSLTDTISGGGLASVISGTDSLTITAAPLSVSCAIATTGEVGVAFSSVPMNVSGGTTPYSYSVVGTLAPGLTFDASTGTLAGTPTGAGSFSIRVADANGAIGTNTCPVAIAPAASANCSLGLANGYNLISLSGDISDAADITGRIAAAGQVLQATTIGSALRTSDPYLGLAAGNGGPWAIIAGGGIPASDSFNINAGGNVFSSTATSANFNFVNEGYAGSIYAGSGLLTGGTSPIDFPTLSTNLQTLSGHLNAAAAAGVVCSVDSTGSIIPEGGCPSNPIYFNLQSQHYNPSWTVLYGTSTTTNIFNISQDQFEGSNNLDIEVPTGSTVIINVPGTSDTLQSDIYFQGNTVTDANAGRILFNFPAASSVTVNAQMDGAVLAPSAVLSGISQMGGVFIAASVNSTGEVHYDPFDGSIPKEICSAAAPTPLSVTCAAVTTGEVGLSFNSGSVTVSGGTAPYNYAVVGTLPAGLNLNTSTGAVTGTPTAWGTFGIQVTDKSGATGAACPITINAGLSIRCAAVTTGEVGVAFDSGPMTVSGGTAPYTYSIVGTLPAGLTLNTTTGAITGTPTAPGSFSVKVTDAQGATATSCALSIDAQLSVTCAAVTTGEARVAFNSGPISIVGGTAPYTYSVTGTLPAGLTLNTSTGAITGTPATSGTFSVRVTDANGATSTACLIVINAPLSVTAAAVTTGEVGVPFNSGPMTISGGTAPYAYSVVGTLPAGLTLNPTTGAIAGTPTGSGTFSAKVTDANGATSTGRPITINAPVSATCAAVTTGEVGVAFNSGPMTISGGTAPFTYTIVGSLPAGLILNTATGAVTGTPTTSGTFSVKVTDANGAASTACSITINVPLTVNCAAVTMGEAGLSFNSGPMIVSGGMAPYSYSIVGGLPSGLSLNTATGAITGTPTISGTFSVKVTDASGVTGTACPIIINAPLSAACAAVTTGQVGTTFNSGPMTVSNGVAPYTYSIIGTLSAGLSLNTTTGAIAGTPTASGTFSVKVTDANGATSTACPITINTASAALSVNCAAVTGEVGVPFNTSVLTVSGGSAPYTYSIVGTIVPGLTLNTQTGGITGTPTTAGSFSVKAKDATGSTGAGCAMTVNAAFPLKPGDTATIGYWHNKNGQALIDSLNGGSSATNLANWLATSFPYLYGAKSSNNLTGKTNADVAALFTTFFGASGQKTSAQGMAAALAVYVTNANLAGSTVAGDYGFNVSSTGTGAKTSNVGGDGTGASLQSNTSYTVMQLLQQANLQTQQGSFDATAFNNIFSNINQTGDLSGGSTGLSVTCGTNNAGQVGVAFNSGAIAVTGGSGSYAYSIIGTLPAGLTLNASNGTVSGTPSAPGVFSVQVTDSTGTRGIACPITIGTGYTLVVNPSTVTVVAGQSANTTFTFTPYGGYAGTISFSCSGLPAGASCVFTPSTLTANGSNAVQTSSLTITTSASGSTTVSQNSNSNGLSLASILYLPGILLSGFVAWRRRGFTARVRGMLLVLLVGAMLAGGAVGCSAVFYQTPVGAHVVTVVANTKVSSTAAAGADTTQTANFTLTITQ